MDKGRWVRISLPAGEAPRRIYRTADICGAREYARPWWRRLLDRVVRLFRRDPEYAYTLTEVNMDGEPTCTRTETTLTAVVWKQEDRDGNG